MLFLPSVNQIKVVSTCMRYGKRKLQSLKKLGEMKVDGLTRKSECRTRQLIGEALKLESRLTFFTFSHILIMPICQKAKHHTSLNNHNLLILSQTWCLQ